MQTDPKFLRGGVCVQRKQSLSTIASVRSVWLTGTLAIHLVLFGDIQIFHMFSDPLGGGGQGCRPTADILDVNSLQLLVTRSKIQMLGDCQLGAL